MHVRIANKIMHRRCYDARFAAFSVAKKSRDCGLLELEAEKKSPVRSRLTLDVRLRG